MPTMYRTPHVILSNCVVLEREGGWDGKGDRKGIEGGREGQLGSKYSKMTLGFATGDIFIFNFYFFDSVDVGQYTTKSGVLLHCLSDKQKCDIACFEIAC